jgi:hypothetical protein
MGAWFDQFGRDMRSADERDREEAAGPSFRRLFLLAFGVAAVIGLLIGIVWTVAGLWHFHGSALF